MRLPGERDEPTDAMDVLLSKLKSNLIRILLDTYAKCWIPRSEGLPPGWASVVSRPPMPRHPDQPPPKHWLVFEVMDTGAVLCHSLHVSHSLEISNTNAGTADLQSPALEPASLQHQHPDWPPSTRRASSSRSSTQGNIYFWDPEQKVGFHCCRHRHCGAGASLAVQGVCAGQRGGDAAAALPRRHRPRPLHLLQAGKHDSMIKISPLQPVHRLPDLNCHATVFRSNPHTTSHDHGCATLQAVSLGGPSRRLESIQSPVSSYANDNDIAAPTHTCSLPLITTCPIILPVQVAVLGGQIGAMSKQGLGSTFWFTVPLLLPEPPRPRCGAFFSLPHFCACSW